MLCPYFSKVPVTTLDIAMQSDRARWTRWFHALKERGVLVPPSPFEAWFVSSVHDHAVIERIERAVDGAFAATA
jgi:glutamate-1-semialdehyde 2,1-aminomutase